MRLHLGAFDKPLDNWTNIDISPHLFVARVPLAALLLHKTGLMDDLHYAEHRKGTFGKLRYMDITRPLRVASGSCEAVFSCHVFEHLYIDEARRLIDEVYRVLKPRGVCRTVVPDLHRIIAMYNECDPEPFLRTLYIAENRRMGKHGHRWGFTVPYLKSLFYGAGFAEVYDCRYREGICPDIDRLDNRPEESIFVEAVK